MLLASPQKAMSIMVPPVHSPSNWYSEAYCCMAPNSVDHVPSSHHDSTPLIDAVALFGIFFPASSMFFLKGGWPELSIQDNQRNPRKVLLLPAQSIQLT